MNPEAGDIPNQEIIDSSLAFFGKVTASVSHELNNVIAIVDQTGGLLQDLVIGEERGIPLSVERLSQAVTSIRKQTARGLSIIQRLNRFAHSSDFPLTDFDMNEVVDNLVALTRRLADLKRIQLEFKPYPMALNIRSNPFLMQQVIFSVIGIMLASGEKNDLIEVSIDSVDSIYSVSVSSPRNIDPNNKAIAELQQTIDRITGQLDIKSDNDRTVISLSMPDLKAESG